MNALNRAKFSNNDADILDYFFKAVEKYPERDALSYRGAVLSYQTLHETTSRLAQYLIGKGVAKDDIVGICLDKGFDVIISIIAILKAGAAYMPVDPGYPQERVAFMLADAKPQVIISSDQYAHLFGAAAHVITDIHAPAIGAIDARWEGLKDGPGRFAYVLFTSGSTGRPKGVLMRQAALYNLIEWQLKDSAMERGSRTLNFSPITFDVSFQEIFATLAIGGTLFLIEDDLRLDAASLLEFLDSNQINRLFLPFVALQMLCDIAGSEQHFPKSLKEVMTAGEQLKITPQVVAFFSAVPGLKLFNQYGPTEAHVVTSLTLDGDPQHWPELPGIGAPIDAVPIYIIKEDKEVAAGQTGELCIGGIALAEGYMNQDALTAEKFVSWVHPDGRQERIYKTGDLAQLLPDGTIEFLGRMDDQVKIRGYRVELGEIETTLLQDPSISNCVVIAQGENTGEKRIVAYLVAKDNSKNTDAVRTALMSVLPEYMIPSAFVWIDAIPKTASGKVNRKALAAVQFKRPPLNVLFQKPRTDIEKNIAAVWSALLQIDEVGTLDNFFELGGNSVLAQKAIIALKQRFQYEIPITRLYQFPTISGLEAALRGPQTSKKRTAGNHKKGAASGAIAIIGMAGRFPGAATIEQYWEVLQSGKETVTFFEKEQIDPHVAADEKNDPLYIRARGVLDNVEYFDADLFGITPKLAELMDPQIRVFLEVSREVLEKTGYLIEDEAHTIGVFAGCNTNTYFNNNVFYHKDKIATQGYYQTLSVSEKDYLATRVAYHLNLKGPAVNVNSACSTSLLAIAQAVENLRLGQCDVAIAGGVAITVPVQSGHVYEEGAMFSNDGHCRPFDAQAKGTVFSDGAGVVLLKRLDDAVADQDQIYAVIKGVGVNNDGGGKGSFTAPSTTGQSEAILTAIADAGVDPAEITYVETHGTATPLGDPIEIEGLKTAFGPQEKKQYCAIGSVKSNLGHLTHAAGAAAVIKTTLSLHYGKLVPSINYTSPNPAIDFVNSPFVVNTTLRDWEVAGRKIAGVSSFGIGGTNVHVILESYDQPTQEIPVVEAPQILLWSSRTEKSNLLFAGEVADFIKRNPDVRLAQIAQNLQALRQPLLVRTAVVGTDPADLHKQLTDEGALLAATRVVKENNPHVVFVFPGQGSQFVNMGRVLYDQEPVYRQAVDECADLLLAEINEDIRAVIFTEETDTAIEKLKNTYYTQPATFVTSYALACYYISKGIKPAALIGHSIGEFVSAHLSGILSLKEAIQLVAARARLISELPRGTMLSVRTAKENILPLLPENLALAANNAPNLCVVSGEDAAIESFSKILDEKGIVNKPLRTSHAFHSHMMDPIVDPLHEVVAGFSLKIPQLPIRSTVTTEWLKDAEATNPSYWSRHVRATVNFSDAVAALIRELNPVFLEVGPGNATTTLIKQQGGAIVSRVVHSIEPGTQQDARVSVKKAIGKLWTLGVQLDGSALFQKMPVRHDLPTYAYDKKKYWVEPLAVRPFQTLEASGPLAPDTTAALDTGEGNRKDRLISRIKHLLEAASGNDISESSPHLSFIELGLDSLLLTQVASSFKREFKLPITFRQLSESYDTIDKLATYLDAHLEQETSGSPPREELALPQTPPVVTNGQSTDQRLLETILERIQLLTQQVAQLQQGQPTAASPAAAMPEPGASADLQVSLPVMDTPALEKPTPAILDNSNPPVTGARLGKDTNGNPAWFVADEKNPGRYLKIPIRP